MKILTVIAARRDSKGIPGKNWKMLGNKPLIAWTIETALETVAAEDICISTNSDDIIKIAEGYGLNVPLLDRKNCAPIQQHPDKPFCMLWISIIRTIPNLTTPSCNFSPPALFEKKSI